MSLELIYRRLIHPSDSIMREIFRHQNFTELPKHCPKNINQVPCTICYTEHMTNFPKGINVDTTHLQPGELIITNFALYNVTSI